LLIAGKLAATGGATAIAIQKLGGRNAVVNNPDPVSSKENSK
jgi:hypothetical protein